MLWPWQAMTCKPCGNPALSCCRCLRLMRGGEMSNVKSLYGNPIGLREVNELALKEAEELLEAVRSGEVIGLAVVRLHHDDLSSYRVAGRCGGYGMIGALEHAKAVIMDINNEG